MCVPNHHYTNWDALNNYYTGGMPLPQPTDPSATPCPADKPYFNGEQCVACA